MRDERTVAAPRRVVGTDRQPAPSHPSVGSGAAAGAAVAVGFTALHGLMISNIWFNVVPMLVAGALCGLCLAWSYSASLESGATIGWVAYNGLYVALLVGLGAASIIVLDPIVSMAEMRTSSDPLGEVLPPALPLMGWASILGTLAVWGVSGRGKRPLLPIAITQTSLVLLIGHNLAILGLVEIPATNRHLVAEFVGLTVVLAAGFVAVSALIDRLARTSSPSRSISG